VKFWQEDLLAVLSHAQSEEYVIQRVFSAAQELGFEYCAYGRRSALPLSNPRIVMHNNYPIAWQEQYVRAGHLVTDPSVLHARRSQEPIVWSDALFRSAPALWDDARAHGLRVGWAQSSLDGLGTGGMLTLARRSELLTGRELRAKEARMSWLSQVTHIAISRLCRVSQPKCTRDALTAREMEVLKWTADGKSSQDIADIIAVSKCTVDFHMKNAVCKLQVANKTAAVVRAALLGYLN
jgi:DNA-binding CsgD family transcriptional regulator